MDEPEIDHFHLTLLLVKARELIHVLVSLIPFYSFKCNAVSKKVKVSHSLIAVGAVEVRVPLYLGHS